MLSVNGRPEFSFLNACLLFIVDLEKFSNNMETSIACEGKLI